MTTSDSQRNEHQHQQYRTADEYHGRELLPRLHRHLERNGRERDAGRDEDAVADQEVPRAITGVARGLGGGDRRRIDHHEADREQE
jgi:hypothetical protein